MSGLQPVLLLALVIAASGASLNFLNEDNLLRTVGNKTLSLSANAAYYEQSAQDCATLGGVPATIANDAELQAIEELVNGQDIGRLWIGLKLKRSQRCMKPGSFREDCWEFKGSNSVFGVNSNYWTDEVQGKPQTKKSRGVIVTGAFLLDIDDNTQTNRVVCERPNGIEE